MFDSVTDVFVPVDDGKKSNLYITKSYDATSHFESATNEILELYTRITGETLDMNIEPTDDDEY